MTADAAPPAQPPGGEVLAVAMMKPTGEGRGWMMLEGTASFVRQGTDIKLVFDLRGCPEGPHATHIHEVKDCGNGGNAAGGHWEPLGVKLGDVRCDADGKATATVTRNEWTFGDGDAKSDVTQHALMIHLGPDSNPGGRAACGLIEKAP